MSATEREQCPRCGLAFADDNDTTHECPPGFTTTSGWLRAIEELRRPETIPVELSHEAAGLIIDGLVGLLVRGDWRDDDPRREKVRRLIREIHELNLPGCVVSMPS